MSAPLVAPSASDGLTIVTTLTKGTSVTKLAIEKAGRREAQEDGAQETSPARCLLRGQSALGLSQATRPASQAAYFWPESTPGCSP